VASFETSVTSRPAEAAAGGVANGTVIFVLPGSPDAVTQPGTRPDQRPTRGGTRPAILGGNCWPRLLKTAEQAELAPKEAL